MANFMTEHHNLSLKEGVFVVVGFFLLIWDVLFGLFAFQIFDDARNHDGGMDGFVFLYLIPVAVVFALITIGANIAYFAALLSYKKSQKTNSKKALSK